MIIKYLDPIILAVTLFLLAVGAGTLAYMYPTVPEITGVTNLEPQGHSGAMIKTEDLKAGLAIWDTPILWQEPADHHRLFDSDPYLFLPSVYPTGDYIKKVDDKMRLPSGVMLSWYQKYGLDFTDPNVDREDPDGDGFSNIVEFKNDPVGVKQKAADCDGTKSTNPQDPQSHPSYLARVRLQKYELRPFHIQFKGYEQLNGVYFFQLSLTDVPSYNQPPLKKTGDDLGFEGYTIGAFHQIFKDETDPNTHITENKDESTLDLVKPDIGLTVPLPFRQIINSPEYTADFVMLMPTEVDKVVKVARGKIFTGPAPYLNDRSFLVIKADDGGAVIRDTKTNQEYTIPKLDPDEWNEVPEAAPKSP